MARLRALLDQHRRVLVMGILNRTPDSFSDGGRFLDDGAALAQIHALRDEGADLIDIGAESTRPGSRAVSAREQIERLGPIVRAAAACAPLVSIDTTSPEVAAWALDQGASVVNSISLEPAAELGALCAKRNASLVLMHSRGSMTQMRGFSVYDDEAYGDVLADLRREWMDAAGKALDAGLSRGDLILDPGLGFAKNARHSMELCARLDELLDLGFDVLVGPSRKSFIAAAMKAQGLGAPEPKDRLPGTIAALIACVSRGARIVRVHDVLAARQALGVFESICALENSGSKGAQGTKAHLGTMKEAAHA